MSSLLSVQPARGGKALKARWSKVCVEVDDVIDDGQLYIADGLRSPTCCPTTGPS